MPLLRYSAAIILAFVQDETGIDIVGRLLKHILHPVHCRQNLVTCAEKHNANNTVLCSSVNNNKNNNNNNTSIKPPVVSLSNSGKDD